MEQPQKRYEYRFHDHVRVDPGITAFPQRLRIAGAVEWRDAAVMFLQLRAYYVFDHLHNKVIKDRLNISKS